MEMTVCQYAGLPEGFIPSPTIIICKINKDLTKETKMTNKVLLKSVNLMLAVAMLFGNAPATFALRPRIAVVSDEAEPTTAFDGAEVDVKQLAKLTDAAVRGNIINVLSGISPNIADFMDLWLIDKTGRIDPEQIAALESRIRKEKYPDAAPKRIAVFGDNAVSRLAVREIVGNDHSGNYEGLELWGRLPKVPG